jgi:aminocarboxymuconate-semialdehyde decarboxylase
LKIDIHSHYLPQEFVDLLAAGESKCQAKLVEKEGGRWVSHVQGYTYPLQAGFSNPEERIKDMDRAGLDLAVLSVAPPLFYYWADKDFAARIARLVNRSISEQVKAYPHKFMGMGSVPMQDPALAVDELHYCVEELGFKAVQIGSNVEGEQYDEPRFLPFFKACEKLQVFVVLHPYYVGAKGSFNKYYLTNLIGNPLDSLMAIASLIFGGVMEECPSLKICLAHGGGFLPYQFGRLEHGYHVRPEPKARNVGPPSHYLPRIYYDSILFSAKALQFLVNFSGASQVLMGTDYPFDMGEADPVGLVTGCGITSSDAAMVLGGNAMKLFR